MVVDLSWVGVLYLWLKRVSVSSIDNHNNRTKDWKGPKCLAATSTAVRKTLSKVRSFYWEEWQAHQKKELASPPWIVGQWIHFVERVTHNTEGKVKPVSLTNRLSSCGPCDRQWQYSWSPQPRWDGGKGAITAWVVNLNEKSSSKSYFLWGNVSSNTSFQNRRKTQSLLF